METKRLTYRYLLTDKTFKYARNPNIGHGISDPLFVPFPEDFSLLLPWQEEKDQIEALMRRIIIYS